MSWNITLGSIGEWINTSSIVTPYVNGLTVRKEGSGVSYNILTAVIGNSAIFTFDYPSLATSVTSVTMVVGSDSTWTVGTGLTIPAGTILQIFEVDDSNIVGTGTVVSYNSGTGALVVTITAEEGTTGDNWKFFIKEITAGDIVLIEGTSTTEWNTIKGTYITYQVEGSGLGVTIILSNYTSVAFKAFGCLPYVMDESEKSDWWAGGFNVITNGRLAFDIVCYPWTTQGDFNGVNGNGNYWDLMETLYLRGDLYILSVDSDFERIYSYLPAKYNAFTFPIKVKVYSFGTLSSNFQGNNDKLSLTLVADEWFDFN